VTDPASGRSFYSLNWKVIILLIKTVYHFNDIQIMILRKQLSNVRTDVFVFAVNDGCTRSPSFN